VIIKPMDIDEEFFCGFCSVNLGEGSRNID
jgi:hypothetical protein